MTTAQFSTKDRILNAAEVLFAEQGFAGTSLREVTSRADVNIAAVNYHFGSKENLINEVFRRRMDEMSEARIALLQYADGEKRYIVAPNNLQVGAWLHSGPEADIQLGNTLPLRKIPVGELVHNIEVKLESRARLVRAAGSSAQVMP